MKKWNRGLDKARSILRSGKGETLMESLISLLAFGVLVVAVTAMVHTALAITGVSVRNAQAMQQDINRVIRADYGGAPVTIAFSYEIDGVVYEAEHNVIIYTGYEVEDEYGVTTYVSDDRIIAFAPVW